MEAEEKLGEILSESQDKDNPGPAALEKILRSVKRIAVVGISRNPEKPARRVPSYLAAKGYDVVPVNPNVEKILGKVALDSLADVTEPVDLVLVFRPSEEARKIAREALARPEAPVVWLQEGIRADDVAAPAREEGSWMIQDLCIYKVHQALTSD